jgi:hypothetical protein
MLDVESTTAEKLQVEISTVADPTAGAVQFAVTQGHDPTSFQAGNWVVGSWDPSTGTAVALTPLLGAGQTLAVTEGIWRLFAKWSVAGETPVRLAAVLRVL